MKTTLLGIAAAAAISLGTAGVASTASAAPASAVVPAASIHIDLGGLLGYRFDRGHYGGYHHRRKCRRLYIMGFRYGHPRARYLWRKYCRYY